MFNYPVLLTLITCGVFFVLATATSPEAPPNLPLNPSVTIIDANLILVNNDTFNYIGGSMRLAKPTGDTAFGTSAVEYYDIFDYELSMGLTDTIPLSNFMKDSLSYPVDTLPRDFIMTVNTGSAEGFITIRF